MYFNFLKYCLGNKVNISDFVVTADWRQLYSFASKQAILGFSFDGVERLGKEYPNKLSQNPIGQDLLMTWMGKAHQIRRQNMMVNAVAAKLYAQLRKDGLRCCILKGQGNALMYPNPYSRTPGDIDVWVNASKTEIIKYTKKHFLHGDNISYHHLETSVDGVPIELHFFPCMVNNPIYNARLQKWFKRNADLQCSNVVALPDDTGEIAMPTTAFNVIYQLCHLYRHFFDEGIGLRQIIDYYFVMSNTDASVYNILQCNLRHLGLWNFCSAVMYVLYKVLGFDESKMIVPMDAKRGKLLLEEILSGGNFGQYDSRNQFGRGTIGHNVKRLHQDLRLVRYYPAEALAEPFFRVWHFFWRMKNKK